MNVVGGEPLLCIHSSTKYPHKGFTTIIQRVHVSLKSLVVTMSNWEKVPHDYTGVGVNPMYQSSGTIATQDSSQYDEIKTTPRRIVHQPPERVTTSNSLYASAGEVTMKHPMLGGTDRQLSNVSPEFMINDNKEIRTCSYCSPDAAILTCSLLVILLSSN